MAKHSLDETAEFSIPLPGRHAGPDTGELEMTQRFDPGFAGLRPVVPTAPRRDDEAR